MLKWQASKFTLLNGLLYRRSFSYPLLRCVGSADADYILREIHEGICEDHLGGRSLAQKALRQGYYWLTMRKDAAELVLKCDGCQRHAHIQRQPSSPLSPLSAPWPFAQWGMDILGPFPPASGQRKFLLVTIDYFTKWTEAEALAKITEDSQILLMEIHYLSLRTVAHYRHRQQSTVQQRHAQSFLRRTQHPPPIHLSWSSII